MRKGHGLERLMAVEMKIADARTNALIDSGCEAEMLLSRKFADKIGVLYEAGTVRTRLPDGTVLATFRTKNLSCEIGGIQYETKAYVVDIDAYTCILGRPWLSRFNPIVNWKKNKMLIAEGKHKHEVDASREPSSMLNQKLKIEQVSAKQIVRGMRKGLNPL